MNKQDLTGPAEQGSALPQNPELIFALDIGTRSIIGVVGVKNGPMFKILAIEQQEHAERAMVDGQIENIELTAKTAQLVRSRLEQRLGVSLSNVFVAAAGRALRTLRATHELNLNPKEPIQDRQILELELCAVQQAYGEILADAASREMELYCVGHSVVQYYLDGYPISTLVGHRGKQMQVEIIATFLPSEVVESLYAAMTRTRLTVSNITLEPIAAMNAIIPDELRLLNIALVDIGAGTSDIAISEEGSVVGYTMATVAGDEITEAISKSYLVDFNTAEKLKLKLCTKVKTVSYKNILGRSGKEPPAAVLEKIRPAQESLCKIIADKILEVNGKAPAAVFLVGGGSQLPGMCALVSQYLGIPKDKVAVGGSNFMKRMVSAQQDVTSPELATPIGIAITAMKSIERGSFYITVNGEQVRLFKTTELPVMDVLLMCGYKHHQIIGRAGKSVTFELNGRKKVVRGSLPEPAVIQVGGTIASISTPVKPGDQVTVTPAVQGEDAAPCLGDVVDNWVEFEVSFLGERVRAGTFVTLNGTPGRRDTPIANLDVVEVFEAATLPELCEHLGHSIEGREYLINSDIRPASYRLRPGDVIEYADEPALAEPPQEPLAEVEPMPEKLDLLQTPQEPQPDEEGPVPQLEAQPTGQELTLTLNGLRRSLQPKVDGTAYLFLDMLNLVDIDPTKPQGNIVLRLNGKDASYLDPVAQGDTVEIHWESTLA